MLRFRLAVLTGLALTTALAAAPAAHAQTVLTFSNRTAFNIVTSGLTTFNFDGYAPKNSVKDYSSLTVQGVTFTAKTSSTNELAVVDPGNPTGNPFNGHQYLTEVDFSGNMPNLNVALPDGTTAFGADFANFDQYSGTTVTALVNGTSFTFQAPGSLANNSSFFGFISSVPITSLSFSEGSRDPGVSLDNVSYGTAGPAASAAPEPAAWFSLGLSGLGLGLLAVRARRRSGMAAV